MTDDGDADDGLKSLRAVWLSMPDEEPPERGLADLMAAARMKAEEMTRPSLWERIVATLRRPPVLALASVTVLVGGALLIGQRKNTAELEVQPTQSEQVIRDNADTTTLAPTTKSGEQAMGSSAAAAPSPSPGWDPASGEPTVGALDEGAAVPMEKAPAADEKKPASRPRKPKAASDAPKASTVTREDRVKEAAPPPEPKTEAAKPDSAGARREDDVSADKAMLAESADAEASPRVPPPPTAAELHARARGAMARGDCQGARNLARQIAKLDATYYKTKVADDKALAGCLAN